MKVTLAPIQGYRLIATGGGAVDFVEVSRWEGFIKLRQIDGDATAIVSVVTAAGGVDLGDPIFNSDADRFLEVEVVKASPSIVLALQAKAA